MIVFENDGEIDARLISSFGVNVKESENPIGFFGTGLKYALAVLLRTEHKVVLQSGTTQHTFSLSDATIRGKRFDFVALDGSPLGFTTELGKTWEVWMAYRELACNAMDEGGVACHMTREPAPVEGKTRVIVCGGAFESVHADRHLYLLDGKPDFKLDQMEIQRRPSHAYFYRGVRIQGFGAQSLYTYNDLQKLDLTEDRTAKSQWEPMYRIARAVSKADDAAFIRDVLLANENTMEHDLDYDGWSFTVSDTFLSVVGDLVLNHVKDINESAFAVWKKKTAQTTKPTEITPSIVQQKTLSKAVAFCAKIGFHIDSYPVKLVESLGEGVLGLAHEQTIFIAERAFELGGTKQVASTLIEEYIHLKRGYADCTREMQSYLFDKVVSLGEELTGEPL